jgi:hypothetical protein
MDYLTDEVLEHLAELPLLPDDAEPKITIRYYGKAAERADGSFNCLCSSLAPWLISMIKWAHLTNEDGLRYSDFSDNTEMQSDAGVMLNDLKAMPIDADAESEIVIEIYGVGPGGCVQLDQYESTWLRGIIQTLKRSP